MAVFFWVVSPRVRKGRCWTDADKDVLCVLGVECMAVATWASVLSFHCVCGWGGRDVAVVSFLLCPWALPGAVPGINAVPHDDNARYFSVVILGPQDSPYAGM